MSNIIRAMFADSKQIKATARKLDSKPIWQWDYGQILEIHGLNLPAALEVHFAMAAAGNEAVIRVGTTEDAVTRVTIPERYLEQSGLLLAYVYVSSLSAGQTEHEIQIRIESRVKPEAWDSPGDSELFHDILEKINSMIDLDLSGIKQELTDYIDTKISETPGGGWSAPDILKNKKILFVGDSICQGVGTGDPTDGGKEKPYPYWIQKWNPSAEVHNEGKGGYTIAKKLGVTNTFVDRIDSGEFDSYKGNVDYVVIQGGINDIGNQVKLGYIRSGFTGNLDLYKFAGGLEYVIRYFE